MIGGFITGETSENKRRNANRRQNNNNNNLSNSIINDKTLSRAEKLAMWKKVKGQRSSKEFNPPAPQTDSNEDAEGALKRSKRVLGIRSRIDKSIKPFQHVQQPENKSKATEVLLSRSGLGKSAMFTMTFSPGNGHTSKFNKYANHNNTTAETTIEEPSVTDEDTNNNTSSIRLEDLAISQTGKEDTAADEEAEKEEINALQQQLQEASERMEDLEKMCKMLESTCGEKNVALMESTQHLQESKVKVQELSDELAKQQAYENTIKNLRDELADEKLNHDKTLKKLDTTQRTYRNAEKAATVMEKAMSKLRIKVETNVTVQKETSKMLQTVQEENTSLRKKMKTMQKNHNAQKKLLEKAKQQAIEMESNNKSQQMEQVMKERDDFKKLVEKLTIDIAKVSTSRDNFESKLSEANSIIKEQEAALENMAMKEQKMQDIVNESTQKMEAYNELVLTNEKNIQELENYKTQNSQMSEQMSKQIQSTKEIQNLVQTMRSQNTSASAALEKVNTELKQVKAEKDTLKTKLMKCNEDFMVLTDAHEAASAEVATVQDELVKAKGDLTHYKSTVENALADKTKAVENAQIWSSQIDFYKNKARKDEAIRRKLHNSVMELKGNIRVYCRVRPYLSSEKTGTVVTKQGGSKHRVFQFPDLDVEQRSITHVTMGGVRYDGRQANNKSTKFVFDRIFTPRDTQEVVYDEVGQMVQSACDGYRVCIFAYGQTGSGKTYTMHGPLHGDSRGVMPRAASHVFEYCNKLEEQGWKFEITVSILEIYNEQLRDLLNKDSGASLNIHHHLNRDDENADTVIDGLSEHTVLDSTSVLELLKKAQKIRETAETKCNAHSSRSHTVFTMKINGFDTKEGKRRIGKINLVDLAGSERLSQSGSAENKKLLKEAQNINKSLSTLGNVIGALANKNGHIPFRDSKLTYLLQKSLGGDCKALMFCNLSPNVNSQGESLCSLRFAKKVNACERNYIEKGKY
jgi:kinesin family protein C1